MYVFPSTERRCFSSQLFSWAIAGTSILLLSACFITRCVGELWRSHSSCLVNIRSEFFLVDCGFSSPTKGISIFLVTQMVKNPPAMQMWVLSLGEEDPRRGNWQPTPVFLPGKSHGQRSLAGYRPWGCKESDTTEWLMLSPIFISRLLLKPETPTSIKLVLSFSDLWNILHGTHFLFP